MSTATRHPESSRPPRGGLWAYVSPSRLNLWLRCPLAFRLRYVEGIPTPTRPAMFLGKMCHTGLEFYYRHRRQGTRLPAAEVIEALGLLWNAAVAEDAIEFPSSDHEAASREQAAQLIAAYLDWVPSTEPAPVAIERTLESPLIDPANGSDMGMPLLGVVDLVLPGSQGRLHIVDFKTAARSTTPPEVVHEIQLTSYAYLCRSSYERSEEAVEIRSLIKTKMPRIVGHRYRPRTDFHYARFFTVVREYLDALDTGRFHYRPGMGCSMCDFRESHCRHWSG